MTRRTGRWVAAVLAAGLVLSGCAEESDDGDSSDKAGTPSGFVNGFVKEPEDGGTPKDGGVLQVATYAEARSLDPTVTIANGSSGGTEMAAVYDLLVRQDPETGDWVPHLAESIEANEDNSVWTLTLRDGVTFSDGSPLDAEAVKWSLDRYVEKRGGQVSVWTKNVAGVEVVDETTVEFTLAQPWSGFPYLLATGPGMIVGEASDAGKNFTPVGAGPYVFEKYAPGEELLLTARPDYWGGAPHLEQLRFYYLPVEQARLDVLRNGEADVAYLREPPTAMDALDDGFGGFMEIGSMSRGLLLNHREDSATGDVRVRQALVHAIDFDVLNERTNEGQGIATSDLFPEVSGWDLEAKGLEHDPEKAKELVEAAKADGFDGKISFKGVAKVSEVTGVTLKGMLEGVGFEVSLDYVPSITDLVEVIYVSNDFDMVIWGFGMPDAAVYPELYEKVYTGSSSNPGAASDEQLDALVDELGQAEGVEEQTAVLEKIQARWNETMPFAPLGATPEWNAWGDTVHGVVPSIDSIMLFGGAWKS